MEPTYNYSAQVIRVIDGDTYEVEIDVGFRMTTTLPLRLAHVDTPERFTPGGKRAIEYVKTLLGELPRDVVVHTYKPTDKYGRYLADVFIDDKSLAGSLLSEGLGKPYEGGKKE